MCSWGSMSRRKFVRPMINLYRIFYVVGLIPVYIALHHERFVGRWIDFPLGPEIGYLAGASGAVIRILFMYGWVFIIPIVVWGFHKLRGRALISLLLLGHFLFFLPYLSQREPFTSSIIDLELWGAVVTSLVICLWLSVATSKLNTKK